MFNTCSSESVVK